MENLFYLEIAHFLTDYVDSLLGVVISDFQLFNIISKRLQYVTLSLLG